MKKFITFVLLALGLVSCSACGKKLPDPGVVDAQPAPADASTPTPPPVNPLTVKGERWEFTLPTEDFKRLDQETPPGTVVFMDAASQIVIILEEKLFPGTLDVLSLNNLRAMRSSGATIVSAKQVDLNGHKFVLVEATKNTNRVWMWMTTNGTYAYGFSCGGADLPSAAFQATSRRLCSIVADSLKIK